MKAKLIPVYFQTGLNPDFEKQVEILRNLLGEEADIGEPMALGSPLPEADAVVFPQMLGDAYRQLAALKQITVPLLIATSEFGTVSMWDWEILSYLQSEGVHCLTPYNLAEAKQLCRGLLVKRQLKSSKLLVFQDNPGVGQQASIFKRFYWWEAECTQRMMEKFGVSVVKKSFKEFGESAKQIPDREAEEEWKKWQRTLDGVSARALTSAVKIFIAVKREIDREDNVIGVGINCLNESHFSDTTPCLAWDMLYEERGLIWGCEADTMSMLTKYILHKALGVPIMMTNLYPFLMGQAALKHEKIDRFPEVVKDPENCILVAHCGFLGVLPKSFSSEWTLRPKVLGIVDENATAIDARLPIGEVTLAKLGPMFDNMTVAEGQLEGYVQYPGSDCRNGGVIRVKDGRRMVNKLASHHYLLMTGHNLQNISSISKIFKFEVEEI